MRTALILSAAATAALLAIACTGTEEVSDTESPGATTPPASEPASPTATPATSQTQSPTPRATGSSGGGGGGEEGTPVPIVSPIPTDSVIPPDWPTFHDAEGGYSFRYPVSWYTDPVNRRVQSFDPASWSSNLYPDRGIVVEVHVTPADNGALAPSPVGATDATFAGSPAWRIVRTYDQAVEGQIAWSHGLSTLHHDRNYMLIAFFEQPHPDDSLFLQIAKQL